MQVHKITLYVLDFEQYGIEDYKIIINNSTDFSSFGECATAEIGEWSDEHPLNKRDADYESVFQRKGPNEA